jgi:oxazoline/thiazoline dehydrogenase
VPALPALPPPRGVTIVELPEVDAREGRAAHASFADVLERRRSIRQHAAEPIDLYELGEFLYRSARVRRIIARDDNGGIPYDATERPYPSGGSTYDLELYVFANRCAGLERRLSLRSRSP